MRRTHYWLGAFVGLLLVSLTGNTLTTWKMFDFRDRLNALRDNSRWEQAVMTQASTRPVLLWGDSQIALWPLAPSFGATPVRNRGISGSWATRSVDRFLDDLREVSPRQVVILIGTNDIAHNVSPQEVTQAIDVMVTAARGEGIDVVVCSVLPASGEAGKVRPAARLRELNDRLKALAESHDARFVDLYSVLSVEDAMPPEYSRDGLHPSEVGYIRMTQALLPHLSLHLPDSRSRSGT